ncbi:MAG: murein biosynthesis integral membrane protein MurJ [Candidatus Komeilibacteria bacterium]
MWHRLWHKLITTVTGGAVLIAFFSIISKVIGLFRDHLLASNFGADQTLDIYYASFRLPDFIFNTLVLGALSAAFIPIFVKLWHNNEEKAFQLANIILSKLTVILIFLVVVAAVTAPILVQWIAPGFGTAEQAQTVMLTRIMLIGIVFFGISNVFSGVLNSWRQFIPYAIAPIFYNVGIIIGIELLYPWQGVIGLAYGVVLGAIMHMLVQLPAVWRGGLRPRWLWRQTAEVKRMLTLMLPRTIGLAANQINQIVITSIASTLSVGSIAVFNLANNLQSFPISIFGLSLAIAAFPIFSQAWAQNKPEDFRGSFSITFRKILFLIIPVSVFFLVLRAQIVRIILGAGQFDWEDTYYTAQVLGVFSLSLFAQGTIPLLARSFYSLEDTKTPVVLGVISMIINLVLSIILSRYWGIIGLALAFSIANIINMLLLLMALRERVGDLDDRTVVWSVFKIGINSLLAGLAVYGGLHLFAPVVDMTTFLGIFIQAFLAGLLGLVVYIILSLLTNMSEVIILKNWLVGIFKPLFSQNNNNGQSTD